MQADQPSSREVGLSRVDVLILSVIAFLVVGIVAGGITNIRELANRSMCQNNLKQLGLGVHNYHDTFGHLPPGRNLNPVDGLGRCYSGQTYLLPFLECDPLYSEINLDANPEDRENREILELNHRMMICPADKHPGQSPRYAPSNYVMNTGTTYPISPRNPTGTAITGLFFENSKLSFDDVTRGLKNVALMSETVSSEGGPSTWDGRKPITGMVQARREDEQDWEPLLTDYDKQCTGAGLNIDYTRGWGWLIGAPGRTLYNHSRPPNDPRVDCCGGASGSHRSDQVWRVLSHDVTARSRHKGGVNVVFGDGSVRFIENTIALDVWRVMGNRHRDENAD